MTNPIRGEYTITLDGKEFTLRPTFNSIVELEEELGPIPDILELFINSKVTVKLVATIIWIGAKAVDEKLTINDIGQAMLKEGISNIDYEAIGSYLNYAYTGGKPVETKKPQGKRKKK